MRVIKQAPTNIPEPDVKNEDKKEYEIELLTPLYGGGATTGVNDPTFPIRPTSVRGQLRFWWRATQGARYTSSKELFEKEKEIWGSTDEPSSTIVYVKSPSWPKSRDFVGGRNDNYEFKRFGPEAYVLFPAAADTNRHNLVREGLKFKISVSYNKNFKDDVLCAVWAWVNFGGIGARTRRGCGALYCEEMAPKNPEGFTDWFEHAIKTYGLELGTTREWPTLSRRILTGRAVDSSLTAWKNAIIPMKEFRQGENVGRNKGRMPNRPGRSRWPEPDTMRRAFKMHSTGHPPSDEMPDGFPRAAFGLPILFRFVGSRGDPDCDLYPKISKRMGSPMILRPLKTQEGRNAPLIAFLEAPPSGDLELKQTGVAATTIKSSKIKDSNFAAYPNSPMSRSRKGCALEAFYEYLKTKGWR